MEAGRDITLTPPDSLKNDSSSSPAIPDAASSSQQEDEDLLADQKYDYAQVPYMGRPIIGNGGPNSRSQIDYTCLYSPLNWLCKGYDATYQYFDGTPDSPDQRFLIDLDTNSMEGLRDVRPYLYAMGYWDDEKANSMPAWQRFASEGDTAIEAHYVRAGRQCLQAERAKGHGYFIADRNWAEYNTGNLATMPFYCCIYEDHPEDVGVEDRHENPDADMERAIIKTNVRAPLPDKEIRIANIDGKDWDKFIQWLYSFQVHPIHGMVDRSYSVMDCQHQRAVTGWQEGLLIREAIYLYPNPHGRFPCSLRPGEARKHMAMLAGA